MTLDPEDIEAIAQRVAELLAGSSAQAAESPCLVDAQDLADLLGVSRNWVYANRERLGGRKAGPGRNSPVRFDRNEALERMRTGDLAGESQAADAAHEKVPRPQRPRRRAQRADSAPLLPLRGRA